MRQTVKNHLTLIPNFIAAIQVVTVITDTRVVERVYIYLYIYRKLVQQYKLPH
jgi:hypothetical protein